MQDALALVLLKPIQENFSSYAKHLCLPAIFDFMDFWALQGDSWLPIEIVSYGTYIIFENHLRVMLFAKNTSKNINIVWSVETKISALTTLYFIGLFFPEKYDFIQYTYVNSSWNLIFS